jgi:hypothetical protein
MIAKEICSTDAKMMYRLHDLCVNFGRYSSSSVFLMLATAWGGFEKMQRTYELAI